MYIPGVVCLDNIKQKEKKKKKEGGTLFWRVDR